MNDIELSRRSFLQGLLGLAGVAVVGLPSVAPDAQVWPVPALEHLPGPLGSLRLDDAWYPLEYAEVAGSHTLIEIETTSGPLYRRGPLTIVLDMRIDGPFIGLSQYQVCDFEVYTDDDMLGRTSCVGRGKITNMDTSRIVLQVVGPERDSDGSLLTVTRWATA